MKIKIIGNNSSNRIKLLKNINKVIKKLHLQAEPELEEAKTPINGYNINNTPALIINGVLVSEGSALSEREITRFIRLFES